MVTLQTANPDRIADSVDRARANDWERLTADGDEYDIARDHLAAHPEDWEPCETCTFEHVGPGLLYRAEPCDHCIEETIEALRSDAEDAAAEAQWEAARD